MEKDYHKLYLDKKRELEEELDSIEKEIKDREDKKSEIHDPIERF